MKRRMVRLSILIAVVAIVVSATMFGSQVFSEPCELDGPCLRACEAELEQCTAACPGPPFEIPCFSACYADFGDCADGCTTCP